MALRALIVRVWASLGLLMIAAVVHAEVRTFDLPMYQGSPLAYCSADGSVCGAELATQWCASEGYDRASNWMLSDDAGVVAPPTRRRSNRRGFRSITCDREATPFRTPTLGSLVRSTVISPSRRAVETAIAPVEFQLSLPGCSQREPGVFLCESVHDYQHCRTLLENGRVFGCRAGVAFASGFAKPVTVDRESLQLRVQSSAMATVRRERRGKGKLRGHAEFEVAFDTPRIAANRVCLQRDRYLYYPTGPMGGMSGIEATDECGEPIRGEFEPHQDDLLRAYDMCMSLGAWGKTIEQPIEILVAGLYHIVDSDWAQNTKGAIAGADIVAPYTTISAPMQVNCQQ